MAHFVVLMSVLLLCITPAKAVSPDILHRGWQPSVEMAGDGQPEVAIRKMREMADFQKVVLNNTEYHQQTQAFVDGLWRSLERFDLKKLYALLPEEKDGWRQLRVYGARQGASYRMGPEASILGNGQGNLASLGDLSLLVKAKEIDSDGHSNYLLSGALTLGVGQLQWPSVVAAAEQTLRIVVKGDEAFNNNSKLTPDFRYQAKVRAMNPALGEEDVAIIAPLWAAFPEMWDLLAELGQVKNVVLTGAKDKSYQHLQASFQIKSAKMSRRYPGLAEHLENLKSVLKVAMNINNDHGTILSLSVDSKNLVAHLEGFVKEGQLLSVKNGNVLADMPFVIKNGVHNLTATMNSTMNILGVITHMNNVKANIRYEQTQEGARVIARVTEVPNVKVDGYALGLMPTGVINFFMPGSIDELMLEFLEVACKGNEGQGIFAEMQFDNADRAGLAKVHFASAFEGLDNFMVRIGMGIVNNRIIPDPSVSDEIRKLVFDTQNAFSNDLDGFSGVALTD